MKKILGISLVVLAMISCRKEELNPVPTGEPGVYGQGAKTGGDFLAGNDAGSVANMALKWIDVNRKLTMTDQDVFVSFYTDYIDKNGNPAQADHGTKFIKTMKCADNNVAVAFNITADEVYNAFKDAKFDFDGNGTDEAVFDASRPAGKRFTLDDSFSMTWAFKGSNGLTYKWWSESVVNKEIYADQKAITANASVEWAVK